MCRDEGGDVGVGVGAGAQERVKGRMGQVPDIVVRDIESKTLGDCKAL